MAKIEVTGTFVFGEGTAEFTFADKTIEFHRITSMEELRGCLVLIAQTSAQRSVESILRGPDEAAPAEEEAVSSSVSFV